MGMPLKESFEFAVSAGAPPLDIDNIAAEHRTVGDRLAAVRKAKGLSYQDVFNGTKIKIANIAAIEAGERHALPAVPFTAGFVKAYAQFLGLNPEEYAAAYRAECKPTPVEGAAPTPQTTVAAPEAPTSTAPRVRTSTIEAAPPPAPSRNSLAIRPEKYVSYFGVGATVLCALWIGARVASPKAAPATPESRVEAVAAAPRALAAAPAAPSIKQTASTPIGSTGLGESQSADAPATALVERKDRPAATDRAGAVVAAVGPELSDAEKEKAEALAAALNPQTEVEAAAESEVAAPATPSLKLRSVPNEPADEAPAPTIVEAPALPAPPAAAPAPAPQLAVPAAAPKIIGARLTRNVEPKYPERCTRRAAPVETVELAFAISPQGAPTGVYVAESSNECFNSAAVNAAYNLRFAPRTADGKAVLEEGKKITFRFAR